MRVTVKTKGVALPGIPAEGLSLDLKAGARVADALAALGVAGGVAGQGCLVAVGGDALSPEEAASHVLHDGNTLTLLPPLRGG